MQEVRRGALGLVLAIAALVGCASTPAGNDWVVVESDYLVVYSDGNEEATRAFYREIDEFRSAMRWFTNLEKVKTTTKTRLMVFKSGTAALPYLVDKDVGAWASVTATGNLGVAKLEGKNKAVDRQTLKRDLVKLWLDDARVRAPTWYREGLAELISAFAVEGGNVTIGGLPPVELMTYPELIADEEKGRTPGALLGEEPGRYTLEDRARVWLAVHYLMVANTERQEALRNYFRAWSKGASSAEAFQTAFGQSPADFYRLEVGRYGTRALAARQFGLKEERPAPSVREASEEEIERLTEEVDKAVQRLR